MEDYKSMYYKLFHSTTEAIAVLQNAQKKTEEMFMNQNEPKLTLIESETQKDDDKDDS